MSMPRRKMKNLCSAKWTCCVGLKPCINAINMETMVAFWKLPERVTGGEVVEAHCTVRGVIVERIGFECGDRKVVVVTASATKMVVNGVEEEEEDGSEYFVVVCFGDNGIGKFGYELLKLIFH
ncbi:unnamed protein product [Camellia sinensis]